MVFNKKKEISNTVVVKPRGIFMPHPSLGWKMRAHSKIRVTFKHILLSTDVRRWRTVKNQTKTSKVLFTHAQTS